MPDLLKDKICLVTGAGRGIGKAIATLFAQEGAFVYVNDVVGGIADDWIGNHPLQERLKPLYFDITDSTAVTKNVQQIKKESNGIHILVNNAAIEYNELIGMISTEKMEQMFRVNVFGSIQMLQTVSKVMRRQPQGGSIINIASMVGLRGNPGQLVYSATKGAVIAMTKSAAKELAPYQIRVNAIAPGLTQTDMMSATDLEKLQKRIDNISMKRIAQPNDIANGCLLLASDYASYISGQILPVDGCTII